MKKFIAILLCLAFVTILFTGCGKYDVSSFNIKLGDKDINRLDLYESLYYRDGETSTSYKDTEKRCDSETLTVCGIGEDDTIEEAIKALNVEPGFACIEYEYDPYGDGCTELESCVYDGTIPSCEELSALDLVLSIYYAYIDFNWYQINLSGEELTKYPRVLKISFDSEGVHDLYGKKTGEIFSVECSMLDMLDD